MLPGRGPPCHYHRQFTLNIRKPRAMNRCTLAILDADPPGQARQSFGSTRSGEKGSKWTSRCDTGRIATISITEGGIRVPNAAASPVPERSNAVRPDHGATRRSSDPGSRRRPIGRRTEHSAPQRVAHPPRRSRRGCWPAVFAPLLLASCQPAGILDPQGPVAGRSGCC